MVAQQPAHILAALATVYCAGAIAALYPAFSALTYQSTNAFTKQPPLGFDCPGTVAVAYAACIPAYQPAKVTHPDDRSATMTMVYDAVLIAFPDQSANNTGSIDLSITETVPCGARVMAYQAANLGAPSASIVPCLNYAVVEATVDGA